VIRNEGGVRHSSLEQPVSGKIRRADYQCTVGDGKQKDVVAREPDRTAFAKPGHIRRDQKVCPARYCRLKDISVVLNFIE
jgi:hypothetical protein